MEKLINLPIKKGNQYLYISNNQCDYVYCLDNDKIVDVTLNHDVKTFVLPKIDYEECNDDLCGLNLENARRLFLANSHDDIPSVNKMIDDKKKEIFKRISFGKITLAENVFSAINPECKHDKINLVVTGNASIAFDKNKLGLNTKVNLILPRGMKLYLVYNKDENDEIHTWMLIGNNIIDLGKENFEKSVLNGCIEDVVGIQTAEYCMVVDSKHYYDREDNCIRSCHNNIYNL